MESVGIRELRQHASRYVAMAKAGGRVAVTERGKRVDYLVAAERPGSTLRRLEAAGQYRPPVENLLDFGPPPAPEGAVSLSEALAEMREEERW